MGNLKQVTLIGAVAMRGQDLTVQDCVRFLQANLW